MTTYLGPVGSLIEIKCPAELNISGGRAVSLTRTLSRQKAFMARAGSREWSAQLSEATTPGQVSGLSWLAEFGNPPFVWYPPDATVGNILDPAVAALAPARHNGLEGALVEVEPGVWVKSAVPNGSTTLGMPYRGSSLDPIPIIPGRPLTISAWLQGSDAGIGLVWRDIQGNTVSSGGTRPSQNLAKLTRVSRTVAPPLGAVTVSLILHCQMAAGPAVTLTDAMTPYSPGKGCKRTVIHGLSEAVTLATAKQSMSGYSITVSEVG